MRHMFDVCHLRWYVAFSQMAFEQIINICTHSTDGHVAPSITFTKMALFLLLAQVAALLSAFDSFFRSFTFSPSVLKYTSLFCREKFCRSWQGSNLRGQSPLDFKSNALTTRPQLPYYSAWIKNDWRCRGSNPGPFTCKANALPLSYIPIWIFFTFLFSICNTFYMSVSSVIFIVHKCVFFFITPPTWFSRNC